MTHIPRPHPTRGGPAIRLAVIVAVIANGLTAGLTSASGDLIQRKALALAAQSLHVPVKNLAVAAASKLRLPLMGRTAYTIKVIDITNGDMVGLTLDGSGTQVDGNQLLVEEMALYEARFGKLDRPLAKRVALGAADVPIPVAIWLVLPDLGEDARTARVQASPADTSASVAAGYRAVARAAALHTQAVQAVAKRVVDRLATMGVSAAWDRDVPLVTASLVPAFVSKVGKWSEVLRIYGVQSASPTGDFWSVVRPTVGVDVLQNVGLNGSGVKVAQVEFGGQIATGNPYLRQVLPDLSAWVCSPGHSTAVAGMIHFTAPGASILATGWCNGTYLMDRSTAAVNWGALVTNHSWGEKAQLADNLLNAWDRGLDSLVINRQRLQVVAAGNAGQYSGNVGSPGAAYNVLTVGNFDDRGSVTWSGDVMAASSSFRDPLSAHGDREKPEVAAPGTNIIATTVSSPWWGKYGTGTGTSYAAPVYTGLAALMFQREPGLANWPVATKAILMATAVHNIQGSARLSEYDGAGGPWAPYTDSVVIGGARGSWAAYNWGCATPTSNLASIPLVAGKRTRVVIAWNTDPNYVYYDSQPSADYDLVVRNPSGANVAVSASYDNTYEIVDFVPTVSGNHTIRVVRDRCDLSPRSLAYAWWRNP